jgi:hypothetical protein
MSLQTKACIAQLQKPGVLAPATLQVIVMDSMDWLSDSQVQQLTEALGRQVLEGGRVIWRSASLSPPYAKLIEDAGFEVRGALLLGLNKFALPPPPVARHACA